MRKYNEMRTAPAISTCFRVFFVVLLFSTGSLHSSDTAIWPVDAKPAITSSFGEYRPGHFHSGIDLKVYGRIGDPCRAVEDGWVSRIKVSPDGYGRALYLKLTDGRTAVYAHLDGFTPEIEDKVRKEQHARENFAVELYFKRDEAVQFKRGEIVAYAGRSGVKHAHLHFEMRDSFERPMNPLSQGFEINDVIPPRPRALAIEPMDGYSTVELDCQPRCFPDLVQRNDGIWGLRDPVGVSGRIGLSVRSWDKADAAENLLSIYKIEMYVNGELHWETLFENFSFSETDLIRVERNFRLRLRGYGVYNRLYRATGNDLDFCSGEGVIDAGENAVFPIDIVILLFDFDGNQSRIELTLVDDEDADDDRLVTGEPMIAAHGWGNPERSKINVEIFDKYLRFAGTPGISSISLNEGRKEILSMMSIGRGQLAAAWIPPDNISGHLDITTFDRIGRPVEDYTIRLYRVLQNEPSEIESDDSLMKVEIPDGVVFDTTWIRIIPEPSYVLPGEIESVFRIEPRDQPLNGKVFIMLRTVDLSVDEPGWGVYYLDSRSGWTFLDNSTRDGYLSAAALSWEIFALLRDVDLPYLEIKRPLDGASMRSAEMKCEAFVMDSTSGVIADDIIVRIDGSKIPAEYDPPRDRILYQPWRELSEGQHEITVSVSDRVGNKTVQTADFTIIP